MVRVSHALEDVGQEHLLEITTVNVMNEMGPEMEKVKTDVSVRNHEEELELRNNISLKHRQGQYWINVMWNGSW